MCVLHKSPPYPNESAPLMPGYQGAGDANDKCITHQIHQYCIGNQTNMCNQSDFKEVPYHKMSIASVGSTFFIPFSFDIFCHTKCDVIQQRNTAKHAMIDLKNGCLCPRSIHSEITNGDRFISEPFPSL